MLTPGDLIYTGMVNFTNVDVIYVIVSCVGDEVTFLRIFKNYMTYNSSSASRLEQCLTNGINASPHDDVIAWRKL